MRYFIILVLCATFAISCSKPANYRCYDTITDSTGNIIATDKGFDRYFPSIESVKRFEQYHHKTCFSK
ncbi:MAG: hypothetical protein IPK62_17130 [Bacteroidetes bacterium]|nr:hypothetical protein [Bacteroidota bacterium]